MEEPDKGWAWVVAFAALIINFIMAGLGRVSGIIFVAFIEIFQIDRREAAMPFSVRSSMRNLLGPVVGILGQKYGVRNVMLIGAVVATISCALCFYSTDILWISILWGGVNGAGTAFLTILPQVVIGQYFKKYRTTAAGMGFSGGCIGSLLFPVLMEMMLEAYGVGGTFLIMAGIIGQSIAAALILREPPWSKKENKTKKEANVNDKSSYQPACLSVNELDKNAGEMMTKAGGLLTIGNLEKKDTVNRASDCFPDIQFLRRNNDLVVKLLTLKSSTDIVTPVSSVNLERESLPVLEACISDAMEDMYCCLQQPNHDKERHQSFGFTKNNILRERLQSDDMKSIFSQKHRSFHLKKHSGIHSHCMIKTNSEPDISTVTTEISNNYVLLKLKVILRTNPTQLSLCFEEETRCKILKILIELRKLYNMCSKLHDLHQEESLIEQTILPNNSASKESVDSRSNTFCSHIKTMFKLFMNPLFLLISLCRTAHFISFVPIVTIVVDFAIDKGMQEDDGKYVIASLSTGDLLGRLCFGWVTDRGHLSLPRFMTAVMLLQGANTACLPLMRSKVALHITLCTFGMIQGSLFVRHPVLLQKYMKSNEQSIGMGCMNFYSGLLGFVLPSYIGYFRDTLGSYDYIFFINSAICIVIGILWVFEPYFVKCESTETTENSEHQDVV